MTGIGGSVRGAVLLGMMLGLGGAAAHSEPEDPIARLSWLSGSWRGESRGREYEEHWTRAAGGSLLGMSRTIREGKTAEFEFLRIQKDGDAVVYLAQPGGRPATKFRLVKSEGQSVAFENLEHDFPQRILYRREGENLSARVEGMVNGQLRGIDFKMKRSTLD